MTVYLCATLLVFAGARSVPYGPGDTLDPDCAPYDTNCFVQLSNSGGGSGGGSSSDNHFTSIHVSGGSISVVSPSSTSTSINYNTDIGYPDNGYAHNYRIYSYKDTSSGRVYSSTYASIPAPEGTIGDPVNLQITQQPTEDTSKYLADGKSFNFRIYAFKNVPGGRVYSSNYAALETDFTDDNAGLYYTLGLTWDAVDGADGYRILKSSSTGMAYDYGHDVLTNSFTDDTSPAWSSNPIITTSEGILDQNQSQLLYTINLSWDAVPGADGYRIVKSNQNTNIGYSYFGYVSQNYDVGYDTTNTSIIDDACNTVCFDANKGDVSLTTAYGESSDLNGLFSLSGPILLNSNGYLNWGSTSGSDGYGIRDNSGTLEYKNSSGTWSSFATSGGGASGLDANGNFIVGITGYNNNLSNSVFIGTEAGLNAHNASRSNFFGQDAGYNAQDAAYSNFFGINAGRDAANAHDSNFFGYCAGCGAINAQNSTFFGVNTGNGAINASNSIFIGYNSGVNDSVDNQSVSGYSILLGPFTSTNGYSNSIAFGRNATNTSTNQLMLGDTTNGYPINQVIINGSNAYLNFGPTAGSDGYGIRDNGGTLEYKNSSGSWNTLGSGSGSLSLDGNNNFILGGGSVNAHRSNFIGLDSGINAYASNNSNFFGNYAGNNAIYSSSSNFFGYYAGSYATSANNSNFFGYYAGSSATSANNSNFFGQDAGYNAQDAAYSNFFGINAGRDAANAHDSNFFGQSAGGYATSANNSNFFGYHAGGDATSADNSNFFGVYAGVNATSANNSNFFGRNAGSNATNAEESIFIGDSAGSSATNAGNSIFIGQGAGWHDSVSNPPNGSFSILIGPNTRTGGYSNSIAIGRDAINTSENQFMIGSSSGPITSTVIKGSGNQCTITTGTGISCSSDIRLKKNVMTLDNITYSLKTIPTNLTTTLDKLTALTPVTYNWNKEKNTDPKHIGLIAQELEQVFPLIVSIDTDGYKSVNYASLAPYIVQAIKEMNLKVSLIPTFTDPTLYSKISEFLKGIAEKGTAIVDSVITKKVKTDELCVGNVCVTSDQFLKMVQSSNTQPVK